MKLLCIDTTAIAGSVALAEGTRLVAQEQHGAAGTHSERLLASIEHVLAVVRWQCSEIEGIAVAIGPGSFTGLRIGLATAKGLAIATGIPVAGASSLASLALNGRGFSGTVVPLIDARRGELYAAAWTVDAVGTMKALLPECVASPADVVRKLKKIKGALLLVGDGALVYADALCDGLGRRAQVAGGTQLWPQAINLAELTHEHLASAKSDGVAELLPNYIRRSDAEIGFLGKGTAPKKKVARGRTS